MMKNILFALAIIGITLIGIAPSYAQINTLDLIDSYTTHDGKICVYSNGHRTETDKINRAKPCPSKKTFY